MERNFDRPINQALQQPVVGRDYIARRKKARNMDVVTDMLFNEIPHVPSTAMVSPEPDSYPRTSHLAASQPLSVHYSSPVYDPLSMG